MRSNSTVSCGPFDLLETIGRGGMAQVWRGVHRSQQTLVAVKVITGTKATDPDYIKRFEREVQAVAALNHPGVVTVFDYGRIDESAAKTAAAWIDADADNAGAGHLGSKLTAGSPYLAMEYARGGTLRERDFIVDWPSLRTFILEILDALAYAHARDVIHRDIKPENILCQIEGTSLRFKLSDFGIAHAVGAASSTDTQSYDGAAAGTPRYMPPEQLTGDWRDFGPWTDLYALGCLIYEIVCGQPPFDDASFVRLANMHLNMPFPALEPRFEVPEALDAFVRRLVVKRPRGRFVRAADAAYVLAQMSGEEAVLSASLASSVGPATQSDPASELAPTEVDATELDNLAELETQTYATRPMTRTLDLLTQSLRQATTLARSESGGGDTVDLAPVEFDPPAPIPSTWRSSRDGGGDQLIGVGLGLFGLRAIPLVDRDTQRDILWGALCDVSKTQSLRGISLRGGTGTGKSRLVEWMTHRAHELGQAIVFKAKHTQQGGPAEGIPRMLENYFETWSLEHAAVYERVRSRLGELMDMCDKGSESREAARQRADSQARGLTELIRPTPVEGGDDEDGSHFHLTTVGERHSLVASLLAQVGKERPVILWADDLPWGDESLGFIEHLVRAYSPGPILVIMTSRDDMLEERPKTADRLADIESDERVDVVEVDALAASDHAELIRRTLHLDSELTEKVQKCTGGNPLFAVQLIGDWVSRGILEVGHEGFSLRQGEANTLPRDIHDLWIQRAEKLLEAFEPEQRWSMRISIELGAVLGQHVDEAEWREACRQRGVELSDELVRTMIEHGLIRRERSGVSFVHSLLPSGLQKTAERAGRAGAHHLACVRALELLYVDNPMATARRRALHLIGAGRFEEALGPLKQAIHHGSDHSDYQNTSLLLRKREELADLMGLPAESRRRVENMWMRAQIEVARGNTDVSFDNAGRAAEIAARHGWQVDEGHALVVQARVFRDRGEYELALETLEVAREKLEAVDDFIGVLIASFSQGFIHVRLGKMSLGREYLGVALEKARQMGDNPRVAEVLSHIGYSYFVEGDYNRARETLGEALEAAHAFGSMASIATCARHLGEVARFEQKWAQARSYYTRARQIERARGARSELLDCLNLAMVDIGDADYERSQDSLSELREAIVERGLNFALPVTEMAHAATAAGLCDQWAFDKAMSRAQELLEDSTRADKDLAWLAETAAGLCEAAGWADRAASARQIADRHAVDSSE